MFYVYFRQPTDVWVLTEPSEDHGQLLGSTAQWPDNWNFLVSVLTRKAGVTATGLTIHLPIRPTE